MYPIDCRDQVSVTQDDNSLLIPILNCQLKEKDSDVYIGLLFFPCPKVFLADGAFLLFALKLSVDYLDTFVFLRFDVQFVPSHFAGIPFS